MTAWRFVHAADLHLDSPFVGLRNYREKLAQDLTAAIPALIRFPAMKP